MTIRVLAVLAATTLLSNAGGSSSSEDLFRAIHRGDLAEVKKLIGRGAPINAKDAEGRTALMHAALYATSDCVKLLLAEGADPNTIASDGATALMYALPDPLKVRMLIEKGANVSAKLRDGKSVLMLAVRQDGAAATVRLLLAKGADPMAKDKDDGTTLMYAAQTGDVETVRLLTEKGVDVSAVAGPDFGKLNFGTLTDRPRARTANRGGYTALMGAVSSRNSGAVKLLLDRGADPNAKLSFGFTPLFFAGSTCKPEIVSMLVGKGANVNAQEYRGATPLIRIAASDCLNASESARILLRAGADWRIRTEAGETALAWARKRG